MNLHQHNNHENELLLPILSSPWELEESGSLEEGIVLRSCKSLSLKIMIFVAGLSVIDAELLACVSSSHQRKKDTKQDLGSKRLCLQDRQSQLHHTITSLRWNSRWCQRIRLMKLWIKGSQFRTKHKTRRVGILGSKETGCDVNTAKSRLEVKGNLSQYLC